MRPLPILALGIFIVLAGCAAESGQAIADTFGNGVAAYDAGDYPKAYKLWFSIVDQDVAAMRNVAMLLREGKGVARDPRAAEAMFARAAEAGLPTAQADLADMLLKGEAGPPNPKAALPLLQAAAAANHPVAQYELAQLYEAGEIVPKDMDVARNLYAAAASHGMKQAQARVDVLGPPTTASATTAQTAPAAPAPFTVAPNHP